MRKVAILLSLTILACSFAGCLGGDDDDCHALSSESIDEAEYDDRVSEQTPPSFCNED